MKKLLNTLFVLSEDSYLALDGENIVVLKESETIGRFPLHTLENILSFSYKGASPALMGACMERKIGLCFFSPYGKFLAYTSGKSFGNVLLRKEQYRISDNKTKSLCYGKRIIMGKVYNCRWILERTVRDHPLRVNCNEMKHVSNDMYMGLQAIEECASMEKLRGIEGELAARYFSVFDEMIINQKEDFQFHTRNRRPPLDYVNALLSFTYSILANECANALEGVGLDAYVGFVHSDRPGRQSLALDLMEELRGPFADRFVLTIINMKVIQSGHFIRQENGAIYLSDKGRKQFFSAWQSRKKDIITHPFLKEKIAWGLVPYVQALLLARTIREDLEDYPPFLWK